jgi:hypothetical protein
VTPLRSVPSLLLCSYCFQPPVNSTRFTLEGYQGFAAAVVVPGCPSSIAPIPLDPALVIRPGLRTEKAQPARWVTTHTELDAIVRSIAHCFADWLRSADQPGLGRSSMVNCHRMKLPVCAHLPRESLCRLLLNIVTNIQSCANIQVWPRVGRI